MYKDILEESWVYQETKTEGELTALHKAILNIVQARFPEMVVITKKQIDGIEVPEVLQDLLLRISLAQTFGEALQALANVEPAEK